MCKEHPLRVCVRGADVHMCEVAGARARNGCARRGVCLRRECVCVRHRWQRCGCACVGECVVWCARRGWVCMRECEARVCKARV